MLIEFFLDNLSELLLGCGAPIVQRTTRTHSFALVTRAKIRIRKPRSLTELRQMKLSRVVLHFAIFLLSVRVACGQAVSDWNQNGYPVFGTFHGSDLDMVSLSNGNLHIEIPIASFPQRHGEFNYKFIYDTPSYTLTYFKDPSGAYWSADI